MDIQNLGKGRETAPFPPVSHCKTTKRQGTDKTPDFLIRGKPEKSFYIHKLKPYIQQPIDRLEKHQHIDGIYPTLNTPPISIALSFRQANGLVLSWAFAKVLGLNLNRLISISFFGLNLEEDISKFRSALFDYLGAWQRRRYGAPSYIWVLESGDEYGLHIHIAVHTREGANLSRDLQTWVKKHIGLRGHFQKGTFHSRAIYNDGCLLYLLKGVTTEAKRRIQKQHGLNISSNSQGEVLGKRWGRSKSLATKAQRQHKFSKSQVQRFITQRNHHE